MEIIRTIWDNIKWVALSFFFCSFAIFFSYYIFPTEASILSITFVVVGLTPLLYNKMGEEEAIVAKGGSFMQNYGGIVIMTLLLSLGIFLSFMFWYGALPEKSNYTACVSNTGSCSGIELPSREGVFALQMEYIQTQASRGLSTVMLLILLSFLLSLFLGAGAILIITWDLSVLAANTSLGVAGFLAYLPQLFAFFLTGLAGVLLSFAILRQEWKTKGMVTVLRDSAILLGISLILSLAHHFLTHIP